MPTNYPRKYHFNESFFLKWSPEMAYVLGFWFADGYMTNDKSYRVAFYSIDEDHLQNIAKALAYDAPVKRFQRNGKPGPIYSLTFRSKTLFNNIKSLGGASRKSLTMKFPQIPKIFLVDFIRGYFDGDGSVHLTRYIRTKDHLKQTDLRSNFTSGSHQFLFKLRDILTSLVGLTNKKVYCSNKKHWRLGYGSKDTMKLLNFMYYSGCSIYLARKEIYSHYQRINRSLWQANI